MQWYVEPGVCLSCLSLLLTAYFWLVRVRKERPNLEFHQLSNFRTSCRRVHGRDDIKSLSLQQLNSGGVLIVNHSLRQNSIIRFDCFLETEDGWIAGEWGYGGDDKPPWNVGPETAISFSPACVFDVPTTYEAPEDIVFWVRFVTASGKRFTKRFTKNLKQDRSTEELNLREAA